jgi:hypothetical protein
MVTGRDQIMDVLMFQDIGRSAPEVVHGRQDIGRNTDANHVNAICNFIEKLQYHLQIQNSFRFSGEYSRGYAKIIQDQIATDEKSADCVGM